MGKKKSHRHDETFVVCEYDPIVQALAPCHPFIQAGCCTVIELVSRVLFMEY